jgi:hypothetical protein
MVYTREAETADEYIERAVGEILKENIRVRVATSDYIEQIIIMGQGAARLHAEDLQKEVEEAEKDIRKRINEPKPIQKNRLFDNLDSKTAELLEKIRLGQDKIQTDNTVDKRGVLNEEVFTYKRTKDKKVFISWHGKHVTTLNGTKADKFIADIGKANEKEAQLLMARATGHFKHGNERRK